MNVPKLRFPGFEGEWQEKKLEEFGTINPETGELPNEFTYIDLDSVEDGKLLKKRVLYSSDAPSRAQRLLTKGDILFQTVRPYQRNNLFFDFDEDYVASTGYAQIRTHHSPNYLFQYLLTNSFVDKVLIRCTGTSYPSINSSDLGNIPIKFPSLAEQQKIASFLSSLDNVIQLLTKKKTLLENYKKGIMQKIFSQEIRFKDENRNPFPDWEEKRLGECGNFASGSGFTESEQGGMFGTPFYKISDMNLPENKTEMLIANNYVTEPQIQKYKYNVIQSPSIIFAKVGAAIFLERKRIASNFCIDNNMMAFSPCGEVKFYFHLLNQIKFSHYAQVGALPSYNSSDLSRINVPLPSLPEQQKIADFLSGIDRAIDIVNSQMEKAKEYKKGLLQKMFV